MDLYQINENFVRGFLLLPVGCNGFGFNWTVVLLSKRLTTFKHSFGYLTTNQAIADAIHSTMFLFYIVPMLIASSNTMEKFSNHCGAIILFCYELSVQTHFIIAVNRFFAAFTPILYNSIFSDRNTKIVIAVLWAITLTTTIVYYEVLCSLTFSFKTGFFIFTDSPVCSAIAWYTDFCKYLVMVIIIVILDISTVFKVRFSHKKVRSTSHSVSRNAKREMNFLRQTVFQGTIFVLELITYFILPSYLENRWQLFLSTSFAWAAVHAADGIVTVYCNPEFKKFMCTSLSEGGSTSGDPQTTRATRSVVTANVISTSNH